MTRAKMNPQIEWRTKTIKYAQKINEYVQKGLTEGWDAAGKQPSSPKIENLIPAFLEALREANHSGQTETFRENWPPAYEPLLEHIRQNGRSIPQLNILDDESILARIGSGYEKGYVVRISGNSCKRVPGVTMFGRSPNRKYFAIARRDRITVTEGWQGPEVATFKWPTGKENEPAGIALPRFNPPPFPTQLIPFPDGRQVLFVSDHGIFVLSPEGTTRLLPTNSDLAELHHYKIEKDSDFEISLDLSMGHGAVSPDGKFIAIGDQTSNHLIFNGDLALVGEIYPWSSYPHFAMFSPDSKVLALNSCHFYNGDTIGVKIDKFPGTPIKPLKTEKKSFLLEEGARVYAGTSRKNEFIIGDANGYVRAFDVKGVSTWQHFIGSSVGAMDISVDSKILVVSTYAGFISIIKLDAGERSAYQIGTGNHIEQRRWIFWKNEPTPLIW